MYMIYLVCKNKFLCIYYLVYNFFNFELKYSSCGKIFFFPSHIYTHVNIFCLDRIYVVYKNIEMKNERSKMSTLHGENFNSTNCTKSTLHLRHFTQSWNIDNNMKIFITIKIANSMIILSKCLNYKITSCKI